MERDRQQNRCGSDSQARPWWAFYRFTLYQQLRDALDGSIYGAVFQNDINYQNTPNSIVPPRYIIALRGTILSPQTMACDVQLNIRIAFENLYRGGRFVQAIQAMQYFVATYGNTAIWIAGHSLGAGLALLAGKIMAMYGCPVEAYIFNPPISLIPLEQLVESEDLKCAVRLARDILKAGIARVLDLNEVMLCNEEPEFAPDPELRYELSLDCLVLVRKHLVASCVKDSPTTGPFSE